MSEPKLISPLLDKYIMGDPISEKMGICCCPALERDSENKCIVKIISTPTSQSQLDALLLTGAYADAQSALQYFQTIAEGIIDEAKILQRLSKLEGFFPYINWQLAPMSDGVGFDVYLLSEYRKTLFKLLRGDNMTHLAALNLALDLCTALAVCRRIGYLYVNLKPENIYFSENGTWKIGDIGFIRLDSLKYASLPERYRSEYTAPEISDAFSALNTTLDVYALGLVLYRIYNGNQLPANLGNADHDPLLPPDFADYEMSEIILKACDPNPDNRWKDPIEMGQALVSYMQRNDVNDTPIIPAPVVVEEPPVAVVSDENANEDPSTLIPTAPDATSDAESVCSTEADLSAELDDSIELECDTDAQPDNNDETAPEQNDDSLDDITVTDEVTEILSQADVLIAHPAPSMTSIEDENQDINEPDNVIVEPNLDEDDSADSPDETDSALLHAETETLSPEDALPPTTTTEGICDDSNSQTEVVSDPDQDTLAANNLSDTLPDDELPSPTNDEQFDDTGEDIIDSDKHTDTPSETSHSHWLRNLLIGAVVVLLAAFAFLFYTKFYLRTIDSLHVVKSESGEVIIQIGTQVNESMLTVVCSDAYGNPLTSPVKNGTASFQNLAPGAAYTINVKIDGFHRLTGETSTAFTTPDQIEILQFNAVTGPNDGSVILTFSTKNQDAENWILSYTGDDDTQITETFSGHIHTLQGLTVGKVYTFKLAPGTDVKYIGTTEITHTASAVITPKNLQIISIADGKLTATWTTPAGATVEAWTARCYNDNGFDQIIETADNSIVFEGIDATTSYTVEVSAVGMSTSACASAPANAISVSNFTVTEDGNHLVISWDANNSNAADAWLLTYAVGKVESDEIEVDDPHNVILENRIPGATYELRIKTSDGVEPLGGCLNFQTSAAEKFSGYGVKAADMRFHPCRTPSKKNWSKKDLANSDYTSTFKIGERASFLVELNDTYNTSKESVTTMFVFRDADGVVADFSTTTRTWTQMWYKGLCELDIPTLPGTAGQYTVSIYMNGKLSGESKITIIQ